MVDEGAVKKLIRDTKDDGYNAILSFSSITSYYTYFFLMGGIGSGVPIQGKL